MTVTPGEPASGSRYQRPGVPSAEQKDRAAAEAVFPDGPPQGKSAVRPAPPPPAEGRTWQERFFDILNNQGKYVSSVDPARARGVVVMTHGSASLQHVQALCHSSEQTWNSCLTARYRLGEPVLGNLLAGFVADLARLRSGADATVQVPAPMVQADRREAAGIVGDLQPQVSERTRWPTLARDPRIERLAVGAGLPDRITGDELTDGWVAEFFDVVRDPSVIGTGDRLVLFVEVAAPSPAEGPYTGGGMGYLPLIEDLPERLLLVVSGVERTIGWPDDAPVVHLDIDKAETTLKYAYEDAPLTGDQPADVDTLDRYRYAAGLARLVMRDDSGPMTIGVHAPWGRGKSTFMHFVRWELARQGAGKTHPAQAMLAAAKQMLAEPDLEPADRELAIGNHREAVGRLEQAARHRVVPVWFNAWQYDGAQQIWAGLTHEIIQRMEAALPWPLRTWRRVKYAAINRGLGFWLGVVAPALVAVLLTALVLLLVPSTVGAQLAGELPDWAGWLGAVAPGGSVLALGAVLVWRFSRVVLPVSERILDYVRQPEYREHMGYQNQVRDDIKFVYDGLAKDNRPPRIVVFIDDLDRCSDEKVLETLQAINLLLTASGFYVFLGIDTHMITQAIVRQAGLAPEDRSRAESYLRKIVQLSFRLMEPTADQRLAVVGEFFCEATRSEYGLRLAAEQERLRRDGAPPAFPGTGVRIPGPRDPLESMTQLGDEPFTPATSLGWDLREVRTPPVFEVETVTDTVHELMAFHRLRTYLPDNPRELKRLVNIHRLVKILVQRSDAPPTEADQQLLVAWLVFCFTWPDDVPAVLDLAQQSAPERLLSVPQLDQLCEALRDAETGAELLHLTASDLVPGKPLYEAAAISSLFHEPTG